MPITFNKYHGTGNDFIIIDNRGGFFNPDDHNFVNKLCERRFGIGADGLILVNDHIDHDYEMKYFNADGRESSMCGNGGRCTVAFAAKHGIAGNNQKFQAADGPHSASIKDNIVSLGMMDVLPPKTINSYHYIDTGSPHYIIPVPDVSIIDVFEKGKSLRWSDSFAPVGTNVNFIELLEDGIKVRTFEKGVEAETLSCGTGVIASAISSRWGKSVDKQLVNVYTQGGQLLVEFTIKSDKVQNICLTGPAVFVYAGTLPTNLK
jgi:diaminopimelate epimerase